MSNQQHDFILYVKNTRAFSFVTDLIAITASWFNTINISKIGIAITKLQTELRLGATISLKEIGITIDENLFGLTTRIDQAISLKKIQITTVLSQTKNFIVGIDIKTVSIDSVLSMIYKLGIATVIIPKVAIVIDNNKIIIAKFIALWTHDGKYLWEMDGVSLEDLDFTV